MGFQHLFHKRSTRKAAERSDVTETYKTLIDSRIDRLESNFQLLRTEWADSYEKLQLLYDRNRKRLQVMQKASQEEVVPEPTQDKPLTREDILRTFIVQNGA